MSRLVEIMGYGRIRFLNIGLLLISACLVLLIIAVWVNPISDIKISSISEAKSPASEIKETKAQGHPSYEIIVEKDLFRESRREFVYKPPPSPPVKVAFTPPPEPPPKRPPPRLSLIGTVLLEGSYSAIIEYAGRSAYYRVGENIEDFVIKRIEPEYVILEREGESLRIGTAPDR